MKLFNRLCDHASFGKTISELKDQLAKADADLLTAKAEIASMSLYVPSLRRDIEKVQAELAQAKREQTEADLFFVTAKILKELLDGKKKDDPNLQNLLSQQRAYQEQLVAGMRNASMPFGFLGSLGTGLFSKKV